MKQMKKSLLIFLLSRERFHFDISAMAETRRIIVSDPSRVNITQVCFLLFYRKRQVQL